MGAKTGPLTQTRGWDGGKKEDISAYVNGYWVNAFAFHLGMVFCFYKYKYQCLLSFGRYIFSAVLRGWLDKREMVPIIGGLIRCNWDRLDQQTTETVHVVIGYVKRMIKCQEKECQRTLIWLYGEGVILMLKGVFSPVSWLLLDSGLCVCVLFLVLFLFFIHQIFLICARSELDLSI